VSDSPSNPDQRTPQRVVTRWTGSGTRQADLISIAPTGKQVQVSGNWIHRLAGEKIVESWNVWDTLGMLQQLGWLHIRNRRNKAIGRGWSLFRLRRDARCHIPIYGNEVLARRPAKQLLQPTNSSSPVTFYDFLAQHWPHLRTTNPHRSTFVTVRLRTHRTKGSGSRIATLTMVFKLGLEAQKHWPPDSGFRTDFKGSYWRPIRRWRRTNPTSRLTSLRRSSNFSGTYPTTGSEAPKAATSGYTFDF
jgi:hypothetical protein